MPLDSNPPTPDRQSVIIQREMTAGRKSRRALYGELIVGRSSLGAILKYELITLLCLSVPGALGLLLRSKLYPCLLKACGRRVMFGTNVVLRHPHKIDIGDDVIIDDHCLLDAKGQVNAGIRLGHHVFVGRNSILSCKNGDIILGDKVNVGFNCEIFSGSRVSVGESTLLAAYVYLVGGDHTCPLPDVPVLEQGWSSKGIQVGRGGWLGAGVTVLDGVTLGDHAIVGAGAVVTRDIPAYGVAMGIPAKVVKDRRDAGGSAAPA